MSLRSPLRGARNFWCVSKVVEKSTTVGCRIFDIYNASPLRTRGVCKVEYLKVENERYDNFQCSHIYFVQSFLLVRIQGSLLNARLPTLLQLPFLKTAAQMGRVEKKCNTESKAGRNCMESAPRIRGSRDGHQKGFLAGELARAPHYPERKGCPAPPTEMHHVRVFFSEGPTMLLQQRPVGVESAHDRKKVRP